MFQVVPAKVTLNLGARYQKAGGTIDFIARTGQTLNLIMAALGVLLLIRSRMRRLGRLKPRNLCAGAACRDSRPHPGLRLALVLLLFFCLTMPSNWTQDVPAHYGPRHAGLVHSWLYPPIDTAPSSSSLHRAELKAGQ